MVTLQVNGKEHRLDIAPDMPLLWVLRERLGLIGTKFGCGIGVCGACTVHLDGNAVRSCQIEAKAAEGKKIITIEELPDSHPLKVAWMQDEVPQCGYCQPGQIMQAASLLAEKPHPTDADIDASMSGIICRCGTYQRIRRAIHQAAGTTAQGGKS